MALVNRQLASLGINTFSITYDDQSPFQVSSATVYCPTAGVSGSLINLSTGQVFWSGTVPSNSQPQVFDLSHFNLFMVPDTVHGQSVLRTPFGASFGQL